MERERYFWVFDRTIFDQIELPKVTLLDGVLIVASLVALGLYLLLIVFLDGLQKLRARRGKQMAWLERWLAEADFTPEELESLDRLAAGPNGAARYAFLSDPIRFETRVHQEFSAAGAGPPSAPFVEKLREKLRFNSQNLKIPVISTRQFVSGDAIRLTFWRGGLPNHFYGKVSECGQESFSVQIRPEAVKLVAAGGSPVELAYLRGLGLEYPFSSLEARPGKRPGRLVLRHGLSRSEHGARRARLPALREVMFQQFSAEQMAAPGDVVADLDPDGVPAAEEKGLLLDLSSGGFALGHNHEIAEGLYIRFSLALRRGRAPLELTGRVQECRPFSGNQWLSRCALRGLTSLERNRLAQLLRLEHRNRLKTLAPVRRRRAKAG